VGRKVIKFRLSPESISDAINELKAYKQDFLKKVDIYRRRIAEEIALNASLKFGSASMEDVIKGSPRKPEVTVDVDERGNITVVVANGEDAVWCEFGAGVYHNGSVGSSPNPNGKSLGFTIGSYGKGYGKRTVWGYYDGGELVLTRGTPASMPMYNAAKEITKRAIEIAREVWR
jgi:hypothetical protein